MNDEKNKNMIILEVFLAHFIKHKLRIYEEWSTNNKASILYNISSKDV